MTARSLVPAVFIVVAACASAPPHLPTAPNSILNDPQSVTMPENIRETASASMALYLTLSEQILQEELFLLPIPEASELHDTLRYHGFLTIHELLPHARDLIARRDDFGDLAEIDLASVPAVLPESEFDLADNVRALHFAATATGTAALLREDWRMERARAILRENAALTLNEQRFGKPLSAIRGRLAVQLALFRDAPAADPLWGAALSSFAMARDRSSLWQVYVLRAIPALLRGDDPSAMRDLESAVAEIETLRVAVRVAEIRRKVFANKLLPYYLLVDCLIRQGLMPEALRVAAMAKARTAQESSIRRRVAGTTGSEHRRARAAQVRALTERDAPDGGSSAWFAYESLRTELQQDAYTAPDGEAPPQRTSVRKLLRGSWIALEYLVTANRIHIWGVTEYGVFACRSKAVHHADLVAAVDAFRVAIAERGPLENEAAVLYGLLIRPVEDLIAHRNLVIIPHEILHLVPFEALRDRDAFLIEQHAIAYVPSLEFELPREPGARAAESFLAFGDPDGTLPDAATEVQSAANMFAHSEILIGPRATRSALLRDAGRFDVLHVAAHVKVSDDFPLLTRIELAGEDLYLFEIPELRTAARLVVLGGCQTSVGAIDSGDEVAALGRTFLENGVGSVVVSLWNVLDLPTAHLNEYFYASLPESGAAEALAAAKRKMIGGAYSQDSFGRVVEFSHPYYWSGLVLHGDWR